MLTPTDQNALYELLKKWFACSNLQARNIWNEDIIARLIKSELKRVRRFKCAARGLPATKIPLKQTITTATIQTPIPAANDDF